MVKIKWFEKHSKKSSLIEPREIWSKNFLCQWAHMSNLAYSCRNIQGFYTDCLLAIHFLDCMV